MALFKIFNNANTKNNLPDNYKAGYCYFDVNTGKFYIDTIDDDADGRIPISGEMADKLRTARTITLTGNVTGSADFDGSDNITIAAEVAADSHEHNSQYLRRDGANYMTGDIDVVAGSQDKYLAFWSAFNNVSNWRLGYQGNGTGETNYFVLQSSKDTIDTWTNALQFGNRTLDATFAGKIIAPQGLQGNADTASKFKTAQTITVAGDATGTVTFDGSTAQTLSLDVGSADQLSSNYKINGTVFNGSKDITTASWGTARNVSITDGTNTGATTSMGAATSGSYSLKLPTTIKATLTGNASTATQLAKAVTIALAGDVSGSASFNGAGDITINTEVADDSHLHTYLQESRGGTVSAATLTVPDGQAKFYFRITRDSTGLFPHDNAANAILAISKHEGNYKSQLGFSNNGSLYYRSENGTAFTDETEWKKLAFTSDNVASADKWSAARTLTFKGGANGNVTFDGSKNVECTVTITDDSHLHDSTYVRRDGTTPITGNLSFNYLSDKTPGYLTWTQGTVLERVKITDSASNSTETFTFQRSTDSGTTWIDLLKIAGDSTIYATEFNGALDGNATSASKWQTARTITLTGGATGSTSIDGSANKTITVTVTNDGHHHSNSTIDNLDASKITSGTISISRLPQGALERLVVVADDTARFKLTTSNVQLGDVVKVTATDVMYFVKDTANLGNANGYELFAAGRAASVNWANIENVPVLKLSGHATGEIALAGIAANGKVLDVTIADDSHAHNSQYLRRDGANYMTGNIVFAAGNTDKAIEFTSDASGAINKGHSWKIVYEGSRNANNNCLSFQSTKTGTTWSKALYFENETLNAVFGGTVTASKGFIGNASTATTLKTARDISLGGDVTGTATSFNGSADITIDTVVTSAQTGFSVNAESGNPSILNLMRPGNGNWASWRLRNQGGNLYFDSNYTTKIVDWYPAVTINYNTGNTTFKGNVTAPKFIGALQGNADTASKWATTRKLSLTGDVTGETTFDGSGNITFEATVGDNTHNHTPETITLNGYSKAGGLDAFSRQMINTARSNKSFHLPAEAIVIEYSQDGGSTWLDYAATDAQKIGLFSETRGSSFRLGKNSTKGAQTTDWQLRVTITPTDRYTTFDAFYAWFCTQGNTCVCDLYRSTIGEPDNFRTIVTGKSLSGWSGNNIIYFSQGQFGGSSSQTSNYYKYRVVFRMTKVSASNTAAHVSDIRFYGISVHNSPNYMVSKDHLYTWDYNLNATFPAELTATKFNGNATSADKWATARTLTLSGDVTGSVSFDGSGAISLTTTVGDDSHYHDGRYVKLTGSTMTGNLVLPTGADPYLNASLYFGTQTRIGTGTTTNTFGIYSTGKINLRPNNGTLGYADGIEISTTSIIPSKNNTVTLGDSTHTWKTVYGNATSASKWKTARTLTIAGDATGSVSIDGSANKTLTLDVATAAKTDHALTVNVTNVAGTTTTTTFNGSGAKTVNIDAADFMPITTFETSMTLGTTWQDITFTKKNGTTVTSTVLQGNQIPVDGSYIIQIIVNDGGISGTLSNYSEIYTGVLSWYANATNSTDSDEIVLHKAGHASGNKYIFLRTIRTSGNTRLKMQIAANVAATAASPISIKIRKLI